METVDHAERNFTHHRRSCLTAFEIWIRPWYDSWLRRSRENDLRRNCLPSGTTWQQCERKPRVSLSEVTETVFASRRACAACKARSFLLNGRRTSILIVSNSKPRCVTT